MFSKRLLAATAAAAAVAVAAPAAQAPAADAAPTNAAAANAPAECGTYRAAGHPYRFGVNCRIVEVDGFPRKYIVYVPTHRPVTGLRSPVVFMFHGSTGTGPQFLRISGWREQADATGLIAVFPQGLRYRVLENGRLSTKWNSFGLADKVDLDERPRGYPEDSPWPADDVGFVETIVGDLEDQLPIDPRRIYASGFSNGGEFTARLAVERSTVLAAAAFSGGGLEVPAAPARPIPMYATVGSLDDRVLAQTGPPPLTELPLAPLDLLSEPVVDAFVGRHLDALGLDSGDFGVISSRHSTSLRWPARGSGPGGGLFRFGVVEGLHHNYPNGRNNPAGLEAAPEFWRFFKAHPLP
jgi:polyhydroxybutyrate depolymerase